MFFCKMTNILVIFILFRSKFHFFGCFFFFFFTYKPSLNFSSKVATESKLLGLKISLWYFLNLNILQFKKKKNTGRVFSGRLVKFKFVLNIAKNSYLKSFFWWNEVENQKLKTFVFKMRYCTWCGYIVRLNLV